MHHERVSTTYAGALEGEPEEALKGFQEVISMEGEQGEWHVPSMLPFQPVISFVTTLILCYHPDTPDSRKMRTATDQILHDSSTCSAAESTRLFCMQGLQGTEADCQIALQAAQEGSNAGSLQVRPIRNHVKLHECCHIARISAAHRVQLHSTISWKSIALVHPAPRHHHSRDKARAL